ncbi:Cullin repeat-like-containing domain protein [Dipodascopsis tothii]|uniref:Cullin repeat-like-containing domain protein n=1 Tax=Dipodascopsis tothii TaxID=44089 RepID=UPI0034CDBD8E
MDVNSLEQQLRRTDELTKKISGSLVRAAAASVSVENAIKPISGSTQIYVTISKNIDAAIAPLHVLRAYQQVYDDEEGPITKGNLNVAEYFQSISRLRDAIESLDTYDMTSAQQTIRRMNKLIQTAVSNMSTEYQTLLVSVSQERKRRTAEGQASIAAMPPEVVQQLSAMVDFFMTTDMSATVSNYTEIRRKYLANSIAPLADEFVKTPARRKNGIYEKGGSMFGPYMDGLRALVSTEVGNIRTIFKRQADIHKSIPATLQLVEKAFQSTMATFNATVKKSVVTECFFAFDVLALIHEASGALLLETDMTVFDFDTSFREVQRTAQEAFPETLKQVEARVQAMPSLPADYSVLEFTRDLVARLQAFGDYDTILASILTPLGAPATWPTRLNYASTFSTAGTVAAKSSYFGTEILAMFVADCVDALIVNIEIKARATTKKAPVVGLQIMSNLTYVERNLKRSAALSGILGGFGGFDRLDKLKKRGMNLFLEGWKTAAAHLMDVTVVRSASTASRQSMSSKDREVIKEKFKNFNADFEELVTRFRGYSIADAELRAFLAKEVAFISPLYHRFYDRHKAGEFTKHTDKYIKYDKNTLDQVLASLA